MLGDHTERAFFGIAVMFDLGHTLKSPELLSVVCHVTRRKNESTAFIRDISSLGWNFRRQIIKVPCCGLTFTSDKPHSSVGKVNKT